MLRTHKQPQQRGIKLTASQLQTLTRNRDAGGIFHPSGLNPLAVGVFVADEPRLRVLRRLPGLLPCRCPVAVPGTAPSTLGKP